MVEGTDFDLGNQWQVSLHVLEELLDLTYACLGPAWQDSVFLVLVGPFPLPAQTKKKEKKTKYRMVPKCRHKQHSCLWQVHFKRIGAPRVFAFLEQSFCRCQS